MYKSTSAFSQAAVSHINWRDCIDRTRQKPQASTRKWDRDFGVVYFVYRQGNLVGRKALYRMVDLQVVEKGASCPVDAFQGFIDEYNGRCRSQIEYAVLLKQLDDGSYEEWSAYGYESVLDEWKSKKMKGVNPFTFKSSV